MFYGENDLVPDLEQNVAELINSLFWVVESKRLERSREKLEKVSLLLAPFEKKDFVGKKGGDESLFVKLQETLASIYKPNSLYAVPARLTCLPRRLYR